MATCLLIHGFGGSPFEMEPLREPLRAQGCRVTLLTLPGHNASPEAFQQTFFRDWLAAASDAYRRLAAEDGQVFVVGLSMGGVLALHLAARYPVAGIVCLATPAHMFRYRPERLKDWRLPFLPLLAKLRPVLPARPTRPEQRAESRAIAPWQGYEGALYLRQLASLGQGLKSLRAVLKDVHAPLLLMQDAADRLVHADNMGYIARHVASRDIRMRLIRIQETRTSHHLLTTHRETRILVAAETTAFIGSLV